MRVTPDLRLQIAQEMAALEKDDYLRPGKTYDAYVGEYSKLLSQVKEDEALLIKAGLDMSVIPKYYGYMEELSVIRGEQVGTGVPSSEAREENRLLTLCVRAQREIKQVAEKAFDDNPERFNKFYGGERV